MCRFVRAFEGRNEPWEAIYSSSLQRKSGRAAERLEMSIDSYSIRQVGFLAYELAQLRDCGLLIQWCLGGNLLLEVKWMGPHERQLTGEMQGDQISDRTTI